jgi:hypothetical protein
MTAKNLSALSLLCLLAACTSPEPESGEKRASGFSNGVYTDSIARFTLEFPESWIVHTKDTPYDSLRPFPSTLDLAAYGPSSGPNAQVTVFTDEHHEGTLEEAVASSTGSFTSASWTVHSHGVVTRNGRQVGEVLASSDSYKLKQKVVTLIKGRRFNQIIFLDSLSRFDANVEMLGIDSSLAFF